MRPLAEQPIWHSRSGMRMLYPKDPAGGGTWYATTGSRTACLLNGGYGRHKRVLPYRLSRGLILLDSIAYEDLQAFADQYDLSNIEPFTLIFIDHAAQTSVQHIKWDGAKAHFANHDPAQPHIWHSPTLYTDDVSHIRTAEFEDALRADGESVGYDTLQSYHLSHRYEEESRLAADFRTDQVKTVSFTSIERQNQTATLRYYDVAEERIKHTVRL